MQPEVRGFQVKETVIGRINSRSDNDKCEINANFIGGKISSAMDYKVGTADGQSEGLQVLRVALANIPRRNGRMLYLGTISDPRIKPQCKSRYSFHKEAPAEVDLH